MLLILGALIVGVIACSVLIWYGSEGYSGGHFVSMMVGLFGAMAVLGSSMFYVYLGWNWLAAEQKVVIINREYNTNYTQAEVFYASDVIETVRQLDRKRYEINGNLMRGEKK